jgi:3-isopropylmalate dehydrogenase
VRIAVIPGDGIGAEVVPAALRVLAVLKAEGRVDLDWDVFDWGADRWLAEGVGIPDGGVAMLAREYRAILFGAVGDPRIPDMAHGRAILLGLRRGLDLYVNHRPIVLPGHTVDLYRENTQGLYAGIGGRTGDVAVDECVCTRPVVERFVRYCLRDLRRKGRRRVTLVHKANAVPNTGALWREVFHAELAAVPELSGTEEYVDAFCYHLIRDPARYEGVLTENLFGDIASDIGAALMGGLEFAASANLCPETGFGLFEPVHGSAPDIAGTGTANPYAAIASAAMLLDHLGYGDAAAAVQRRLNGHD